MLSSIWKGITSAYVAVEAWVAGWWPGFKTELVALLGMIGSAASLGSDYLSQISGMPVVSVIGSKIGLYSLVLFSLAFWLRGIGDRVAARA